MRNIGIGIILIISFVTFFGCQGNEKKFIPDVSSINVDANIKRFEQDLFNLDTNNIYESVAALEEKYLEFSDIYFAGIMNFKRNFQDTSKQYVQTIVPFINYPSVQKLYDTCQQVYGDFSLVTADLEMAFKYYKYYFPNKKTPNVTTFISEYGVGVGTIGEEEIIIGLDMFLGKDYPPYYYPPVQLPNYVTRTMNREHIVPKAMEALAGEIVGQTQGNRLLDFMINNGKRLYLLDLFQPQVADSIRLGYTSAQVDWLKANEGEMWKTVFIDNLYEIKLKQAGLLGLIEPAPTSPGMPNESPGSAGNWVGWQIVKQYMANVPNITVEQLLAEKDAQKILQGSRYKPKN